MTLPFLSVILGLAPRLILVLLLSYILYVGWLIVSQSKTMEQGVLW